MPSQGDAPGPHRCSWYKKGMHPSPSSRMFRSFYGIFIPPGCSRCPEGMLWPLQDNAFATKGLPSAPHGDALTLQRDISVPQGVPAPMHGPTCAVQALSPRGCGSPWASLGRPSLQASLRHRMTKGSSQGAAGPAPHSSESSCRQRRDVRGEQGVEGAGGFWGVGKSRGVQDNPGKLRDPLGSVAAEAPWGIPWSQGS